MVRGLPSSKDIPINFFNLYSIRLRERNLGCVVISCANILTTNVQLILVTMLVLVSSWLPQCVEARQGGEMILLGLYQ